jgi:hypothetical protein
MHNWAPTTACDNPFHFLITIVDFLVLSLLMNVSYSSIRWTVRVHMQESMQNLREQALASLSHLAR